MRGRQLAHAHESSHHLQQRRDGARAGEQVSRYDRPVLSECIGQVLAVLPSPGALAGCRVLGRKLRPKSRPLIDVELEHEVCWELDHVAPNRLVESLGPRPGPSPAARAGRARWRSAA